MISNEEVLSWLLTPGGIAFLLWALASALTLSVAQFDGRGCPALLAPLLLWAAFLYRRLLHDHDIKLLPRRASS